MAELAELQQAMATLSAQVADLGARVVELGARVVELGALAPALEGLEARLQTAFASLQQRIVAIESAQASSSSSGAPTTAPLAAAPSQSNRLPLPKPTRFGGRSKDTLPWLSTLKAYLHVNNVRDVDAVIYAAALLEGDAKTWFMACQAQHGGALNGGFTDIAAFEAALRRQFEEQFPADKARDQLAVLKQRTSVADYANRFNALLIHLPNRDEGDNIHTFIRGLKPAIAMQVSSQMPRTLAEAVDIAIKTDGAALNVYRMQRGTHRSSGAATSAGTSGATPMDLNAIDDDSSSSQGNESEEGASSSAAPSPAVDLVAIATAAAAAAIRQAQQQKLKPEQREKLQREGRCFLCEKKGHLAKDCPTKKK